MEIDLSKVDPDNLARVQMLLKEVGQHQKFNTKLASFLDEIYPWQKKAANLTGDHKVVGLLCGNQMGKTETACAIVAMHLIGVYPDWYEGRKFLKKPPNILVAGVDSNFNKNTLQKRLFGTNNRRMKQDMGTGMIPLESVVPNSIVSSRGDEVSSCKFFHSSGGQSEIIFKGYSDGREAVQGYPADVVYIDEQPKDDFWEEVLFRTTATKGIVICAFTPLKGVTNLIRTFTGLPEEKDAEVDKFGPKSRSNGRWAMVRATWDDAPHIDDETQQTLLEGALPYTVDARMYGVPVAGFGHIFPHGADKISYNPEHMNIQDKWVSLIGVDFGFAERDPSAMIKVSWDEDNDVIYVSEEFKGHTPTDKDFVKNLNFIDPDLPVVWPRDGNNRASWKGGDTYASKLRDMGVNLLHKPFLNPKGNDGKRNNHKAPGFEEINSRFATNRLKISTKCDALLTEIAEYAYDINGGTDKNEDHAIDAFRYAVMSIIQGKGEAPQTDRWGNDNMDDVYAEYDSFYSNY